MVLIVVKFVFIYLLAERNTNVALVFLVATYPANSNSRIIAA